MSERELTFARKVFLTFFSCVLSNKIGFKYSTTLFTEVTIRAEI